MFEREIFASTNTVWHALTDIFELRAWWAMPVVELDVSKGGQIELSYVKSPREDYFTFDKIETGKLIEGTWRFNWSDAQIKEKTILKAGDGLVSVQCEQQGFGSFGEDTGFRFAWHKREVQARVKRLQKWCENRIPANMATMPV
jgi:uncharacterized protein YndB with AHSA1/START domain